MASQTWVHPIVLILCFSAANLIPESRFTVSKYRLAVLKAAKDQISSRIGNAPFSTR